MGGVVKKKKKSVLAKAIEKFKVDVPKPNSSCEEYISDDVPLDDIRTNVDDLVAIASRRDELRAAKHGNTDVITSGDT